MSDHKKLRGMNAALTAVWNAAIDAAIAECEKESLGHGGIAARPMATEAGAAIHEAMAAGAANCATRIRKLIR